AIVILVAITGQRDTHVPNAAHIEIVGEHYVVVGLFLTIPIGVARIVQVNRNTGIPEVLVIGGGVHLFIIARANHCAVICVQILAHGHIVLFREAVSGEGDAAVEFIKVFGVTDSERVTVERAFSVSG